MFILRFSLGLGAWRFLWFSFVSLYSFRFFFVLPRLVVFVFEEGRGCEGRGERSHIWESEEQRAVGDKSGMARERERKEKKTPDQ